MIILKSQNLRPLLLMATAFLVITAHAQSNLSFLHMQNGMPQSSNYNPALFPDAKIYVSLPAVSGINISLNNSFGVLDLFTATGDSTLLDITRFLSEQNSAAYLNARLSITDLMIGYKLPHNSHISLFINERLEGSMHYPLDLLRFIWEGNQAYVGKNYLAKDFFYNFTAYRELGLGYGKQLTVAGLTTRIGVRLKYITGLIHGSTEEPLGVSVYTDEKDYAIEATFHDATIRSAGLAAFSNQDAAYFLVNGNHGSGLDFGVSVKYNNRLTFGLAVNDLGWIKWKEYAESIYLDGAGFRYEGINLGNITQMRQTFQDSLNSIRFDTVASEFKTFLNTRTFLTASYQVTGSGYAQASLATHLIEEKLHPAFGIGYLQHLSNWLSASTTAQISPRRGIDFGAGLMLRGGFSQFYLVADNLTEMLNENARSINLQFGINFLFGGRKTNISTDYDKSLLDYEQQLKQKL